MSFAAGSGAEPAFCSLKAGPGEAEILAKKMAMTTASTTRATVKGRERIPMVP